LNDPTVVEKSLFPVSGQSVGGWVEVFLCNCAVD
jgi:hypothetical protein